MIKPPLVSTFETLPPKNQSVGDEQSRRYLFLAGRAAAVGGGQRGRAGLRVPGHVAVLGGAADGQRPDRVGVAVAVAVVVVEAAVA